MTYHAKHKTGRRGGGGVRRGNLDPQLPLMQLFLATFMPWNQLNIPPDGGL